METTRLEAVSYNCISWGAIIAGVFVALAVAALLNLLGLGLDLLTLSAHKGTMIELSALSIVWLVLTSIIAMTAGGWIAGRMSGPAFASEGVLHGLVTWAVTTLLTFMLVTTSVGAVVGVMATMVGHSMILVQENPMNAQGTSNNQQNYGLAQQSNQTAQTTGEKAEHSLGMATLIIFISYLISAIASAFGGMWGAYSDRKLFVKKPAIFFFDGRFWDILL
jgi:hypothetical protein